MTTRLDALYTPLEQAAATLRARHAALSGAPQSRLEARFRERPHAVLFRQVATPNFEMERFVSLARSAGLVPLVLEFHGDKFVHCNPDKYALARMTFHAGMGRNGGIRSHPLSVADMTRANGRPLHKVRTLWGQGLIPFHHGLLRAQAATAEVELHDATDWFREHGGSARGYYRHLFELFIGHAVLVENFLMTPSEKPFTTEVTLPAFESVCARCGQRPLVCRLDPPESEGDSYWLQYPASLLPVAKGMSAGRIL